MLIYISMISSLGVVALLSVAIFWNHRINKGQSPMEKELLKRRKEAKGKSHKHTNAYQELYELFMSVPLIRDILSDLYGSFVLIGEKNKSFLIRKTVRIVSGLLVIYTAMLVFFWMVTRNIVYTGVFGVLMWYLSDGYIDYFVSHGHHRLLEQFLRFLSYVRQKYYEHKIVDDAVYEATQALSKDDREMTVQGEMIYEVFMSSDKEMAITRYMETAPNTFLKMFVNFSNMTMEYGDQKVEGSSIFLMNLSFLAKNVQLELDKRRQLNYALRSMNVIVMLPLFFIAPLKNWSVSNFAPLGIFYKSPMGKYMELITLCLIIVSMRLLNKVQNTEKADIHSRKLDNLLRRIKIPIHTYEKKKWLYGISGFMIMLILILSVLVRARVDIKTQTYYQDQFLGALLEEEEASDRRAESELDYVYVKKSSQETDKEAVIQYLIATGEARAENAEDIDDERVEHILEKIKLYHSYRLSYIHIILCLLVGLVAYNIPDINRQVEKRIHMMDSDDEIAGFRSIIMMLMYNPRMSVEEIIEWMESYAKLFKEELHRCSLNISSGEFEAVKDLENQVEHKEMKRLCYQLAMACEDIGLLEAFDELVQEKATFFEQRKWQNEKLIGRKIVIGQNIGFLPAYSLIIFYMIIPMVVTSAGELGKFFKSMM